MNILLWILQILLALLFLFAGITKLVMPIDVLESMGSPNAVKLPGMFIKFIGLVETLGALGLILPGIFHRRTELTPLAAAGLAIVMIGAVVVTIMGDGIFMAITPLIVGLLCLFVAYERWKAHPLK